MLPLKQSRATYLEESANFHSDWVNAHPGLASVRKPSKERTALLLLYFWRLSKSCSIFCVVCPQSARLCSFLASFSYRCSVLKPLKQHTYCNSVHSFYSFIYFLHVVGSVLTQQRVLNETSTTQWQCKALLTPEVGCVFPIWANKFSQEGE